MITIRNDDFKCSNFVNDFCKFEKFFYTGKREGGKVDGNLIVLGGGDPLLVTESLFDIAVKIKALGFRALHRKPRPMVLRADCQWENSLPL